MGGPLITNCRCFTEMIEFGIQEKVKKKKKRRKNRNCSDWGITQLELTVNPFAVFPSIVLQTYSSSLLDHAVLSNFKIFILIYMCNVAMDNTLSAHPILINYYKS